MSDNVKTATLTNADVDAAEAAAEMPNPFAPIAEAVAVAPFVAMDTNAPAVDPFEGQDAANLTDAPATGSERPRTKRRIVTKVEKKHLAQEMLMHGIGNVLGYWHKDVGNQQKLAELDIDQEEFGTLLLAQADRAAKALGFAEAWSN